MFNALWDLPIGEEEDRGGQAGQGGGWLTRTLSHIELAPIVTVESGRPVNPLNGLDSNQNHAFPLSSRPLTLGRNSLTSPLSASVDFWVLRYFAFGGVKPLDLVTEFFNLLNRANVSEMDPVFGSAFEPLLRFRQPIAGSGARQVQFSLDFEF